ncbi:hypothetical protein F6V30_16530 [Oryzomonas sagensis]|uniref:Uncharacterized protein n=1 Tax=Oryzomonas sagensis TaxID=2603857 RepID=A0ABQ6TK00_9BACT|nr:hypothetical protein [Oryzomonas sagensis]KAB0668265.1 hypothetical protein F6V30_16530 [Oryzomonas sagensis]
MNKLLGFLLVTLTILTSATASNGATSELTKLLESRDFWSTYKWETFEDSELYKSAPWKSGGWSGIGDTKISDNYTTPISISNLSAEAMNMYVNTKTKEVNSFAIYSINRVNTDDYTQYVSWCNEKFGDNRVENKRTETFGEYVRNTTTSSWTLENTVVRVSIENNLSNGLKSVGFITTLSFTKNYRPQVDIENGIPSNKADQEKAEGRAENKDYFPPSSQSTPAISGRAFSIPAHRPAISSSANTLRSITSDPNAVKPVTGKQYSPPPYIWENELGITQATNDILSVPEDKRAVFEISVQK